MKTQTAELTTLDDRQIPVQAKLAAAWTSFMFLYIYVDILNFYKPGVVDGILNGLIWKFDINSTLLTIFLVSVSIPALMVVLSMTLPTRVNRATNLVVASLLIPYSMFNAAGTTWDWAAFYGISIGIELLLLAFILRAAWIWPRAASSSLPDRVEPKRSQIQLGR
jgi:phage shock protein PspC (stress-responsive transcriptional regulator)